MSALDERLLLFAKQLNERVRLTNAEIAFLVTLEKRSVALARHQMVVEAGESAREAFVLKTGWAMSYTHSEDGALQVRRLHFPGDLLAMSSIPMRHHVEDIQTLSDAIVAPFDKRLLGGLFGLPKLAAIMYMFAQAERISAGDRLVCLGTRSAKGRMAFLLLDILNRLRVIDPSVSHSFQMHLTREEMAHSTGMTAVHASRMWSELIADRLIATDGSCVTILDEDRLLYLSGYVDRKCDLDFGWLASIRGTRQS